MMMSFLKSERAAISVEAAIIMPVLLFFYASAFIYYDAFRSYNVTIKASYTLGDTLSRQTSTVTSDDIEGLERLYEYLTFSTDTSPWIRVTEVERKTSGFVVTWSHATDSQPERTETTDILKNLPTMAHGERVVVVETFSSYSSFINVGITDRTWSNTVVTRPRFASTLPFNDLTS